jgi:hypothetical protein
MKLVSLRHSARLLARDRDNADENLRKLLEIPLDLLLLHVLLLHETLERVSEGGLHRGLIVYHPMKLVVFDGLGELPGLQESLAEDGREDEKSLGEIVRCLLHLRGPDLLVPREIGLPAPVLAKEVNPFQPTVQSVLPLPPL